MSPLRRIYIRTFQFHPARFAPLDSLSVFDAVDDDDDGLGRRQ